MSLGPVLVLVLGLFAYRGLFLDALQPSASSHVDEWFFTPEQKSPLLAIGIAGWLLWRRRAVLLGLPDRCAGAWAAALLVVGTGLFVWARLTGAASLLLPSLAANALAFASAVKGRAGCRAALLPALVLLLGAPIPAALRDELLWRLQLWTARDSAWLMQLAGADVVLRGVQIQGGEYAFTVIESCSGMRGIEILTLVAVAVRELFAAGGWRAWLVVLAAPGLGFALNVGRVIAVAAQALRTAPAADAAQSADHTLQGIAVLVVGTAALYALGHWLAGARWSPAAGEAQGMPRSERSSPRLQRGAAAALLAALAVVSIALPPFAAAPPYEPLEFPAERAGWTSEELAVDSAFIGPLRGGEVLIRRYEGRVGDGPARFVDLFIGYEVAENPFSRFFSPKLVLPGHDWTLVELRPTRIWPLKVDAAIGVATRDGEQVLVTTWRLRDRGFWREASRSALGLESGPFRREPRRAVVRLTTALANDGPVARDRARRTLDRFIADFQDELERL